MAFAAAALEHAPLGQAMGGAPRAPLSFQVATSVPLTATLVPLIRSFQSPRPEALSPRPTGSPLSLPLASQSFPASAPRDPERRPRARAYLLGWC